jgi:hypothetical protein
LTSLGGIFTVRQQVVDLLSGDGLAINQGLKRLRSTSSLYLVSRVGRLFMRFVDNLPDGLIDLQGDFRRVAWLEQEV